MTKYEAILNDWLTALRTIKPANEYETGKNYSTDFSNCVFDWDDKPIPDGTTLQMIVEDRLLEQEENPEISGAGHYWFIELTHKIFLPAGSNTIGNLRKAGIDIIHCVGKNEGSFWTKFGGDTVFSIPTNEKALDKKNKTIGASRITIRVRFNSNRWMIGDTDYV